MLTLFLTLILMRGDFDVVETHPLTRSSPFQNRIEEWTPFKDNLEEKAAELALKYQQNDNQIRRHLVKTNLTRYAYELPNLHGPFTPSETQSVKNIVENACKIYDQKIPALPAVNPTPQIEKAKPPAKTWFHNVVVYGPSGRYYYVPLYAWRKPANPTELDYVLTEQTEQVQWILTRG